MSLKFNPHQEETAIPGASAGAAAALAGGMSVAATGLASKAFQGTL